MHSRPIQVGTKICWPSVGASVRISADQDDVLVENTPEQLFEIAGNHSVQHRVSEAAPTIASPEPLLRLAQDIAAALVRLEYSIINGHEVETSSYSTPSHITTRRADFGKSSQATTTKNPRAASDLQEQAVSSTPLQRDIPTGSSKSTNQYSQIIGSSPATPSNKRKNEDGHEALAVKRQRTDPAHPVDDRQPLLVPSPKPNQSGPHKRKKEEVECETVQPLPKRHCSTFPREGEKLGRFDTALLDPALFDTTESSEQFPVILTDRAASEEVSVDPSTYPTNLDHCPQIDAYYTPVNPQTDPSTHIPGLSRLFGDERRMETHPVDWPSVQNVEFTQQEAYPSPNFEEQYVYTSDLGTIGPFWEAPSSQVPLDGAASAGPSVFSPLPSSNANVLYNSHGVGPYPSPPQPTATHGYPSPPTFVYQSSDHFMYRDPEPTLLHDRGPSYPVAPSAAENRGSRRIGSQYHHHHLAGSDSYGTIDNSSGDPNHSSARSEGPSFSLPPLFPYPPSTDIKNPWSSKRARSSTSGLPRFATLFEPVSSIRYKKNKLALPRILQDQVSPLPPISSRTPGSPLDDSYDEDDFCESFADIKTGEWRLRHDKVLGKYQVGTNKKCPPSSSLRSCVTVIPDQEKWFMQDLEHDLEEELNSNYREDEASGMSRKRSHYEEEDNRSVKRSREY